MAHVLADFVRELTATSGTSAYQLAGNVPGYRTFGAGVGVGNTTYYGATDGGSNWEIGLGTVGTNVTTGATEIVRTQVLASSNGNAAVNWGSEQKVIYCTVPAGRGVALGPDGSLTLGGNVAIGGTLSVTGATTLTGSTTIRLGMTLQGSDALAIGRIVQLASRDFRIDAFNGTDFNGTLRFRADAGMIFEGGNVGIGTSSPTAGTRLDVVDAGPAIIRARTTAAAGTNVILAGSDGGLGFVGTTTNHALALITNDAERARIDANGNFGIGTSSLAPPAGYRLLALDNTTGAIVSFRAGGTEISQVFGDNNGMVYVVNGARVHRWTGNSLERMRIDINGNFLVNTSTAYARMAVFRNDGGTALYCGAYGAPGNPSLAVSATTVNGTLIEGHNQNSIVMFRVDGGGQVTNFSGGYGVISDRKHKVEESITPASSQWDDIKALSAMAVNYRLKADPTGPSLLGWIAQDVETICPYLISETPDYETVQVPELDDEGSPVLDDEGNPVTKSVNQPNGEVTKTIKTSVAYMKALVALGENMTRTEKLETACLWMLNNWQGPSVPPEIKNLV